MVAYYDSNLNADQDHSVLDFYDNSRLRDSIAFDSRADNLICADLKVYSIGIDRFVGAD